VEEGDNIRRGQVLARFGNSGNTTAPHLLKNPQPREEELPLSQSVETFPTPRGH
jgi:hypothetical protein